MARKLYSANTHGHSNSAIFEKLLMTGDSSAIDEEELDFPFLKKLLNLGFTSNPNNYHLKVYIVWKWQKLVHVSYWITTQVKTISITNIYECKYPSNCNSPDFFVINSIHIPLKIKQFLHVAFKKETKWGNWPGGARISSSSSLVPALDGRIKKAAWGFDRGMYNPWSVIHLASK